MARKWKGYLGGSTVIGCSRSTFERNLAKAAGRYQRKKVRDQKQFDDEREKQRRSIEKKLALINENPLEYDRRYQRSRK